jgi:hypothetical protein
MFYNLQTGMQRYAKFCDFESKQAIDWPPTLKEDYFCNRGLLLTFHVVSMLINITKFVHFEAIKKSFDVVDNNTYTTLYWT